MSRRYNIQNLEELQQQVLLLRTEYKMQGSELKQNAKLYVKQFTLGSLIKKYATPSAFIKMDDKLNISSKLMSMVLPILMNSTLFRGSGFLTKTLVGLTSSKFGKTLDAEHLSAIFNSIKGWFSKKKKKEKQVEEVDYGIPPYSETY
ncbi:hypothetical protein [Pedobacter nutrimenti]|jgi:hypothetical protein|uniref:Uncharacterized protein n=1 Tax=Pedobacter nutrimenti TaxID=1241337 RepID=A0A318UI16_9SPHI|nr:hypothetical protein [Pedobacter nutrimenti]PYF75723.1 hypothetical protein B0O44_102277 [Pedobacter nutrimenti]